MEEWERMATILEKSPAKINGLKISLAVIDISSLKYIFIGTIVLKLQIKLVEEFITFSS